MANEQWTQFDEYNKQLDEGGVGFKFDKNQFGSDISKASAIANTFDSLLPPSTYGEAPTVGKSITDISTSVLGGASTGFTVGGPVGAVIGGGFGLATSLFKIGSQAKVARQKREEAQQIDFLTKNTKINELYSNIMKTGQDNLNQYQNELDLVNQY